MFLYSQLFLLPLQKIITEHGPNIPGTCDLIYFRNLHVVPRNIMPLAKKCDFPDELVLNYSPEKFLAYIKPMPK